MKLVVFACLALVACAQYDDYNPDYYSFMSINDVEKKVEGGVKKALNKAKSEINHLKGEACDLCTKAVQTVQQYADDDLPTLQKKLEQYCNYAPAVFKDKCIGFVDKEIPAIKNMVDNKMTAQQICTNTLHLCTGGLEFWYDNWNDDDPNWRPDFGNSDDEYSDDDYNPDYYSFMSINSVKDKVKQEIKALENKLKHGAQVAEKKAGQEIKKVRGQACELCKKVVTTIKNNADEDLPTIQKKLEKYCNYVPATYKAKCVSFIDKEIPAIKNMVDNKMNAQQICTNTLHLCTGGLEFIYDDGSYDDYQPDYYSFISYNYGGNDYNPDYYSFMSVDDVKEKVKEEIKALEDKLKNGIKAAEDKAADEITKLEGQACDLCTNVVKTVKQNIDDDTPTLQAKLESYCKYMPAVLEQNCINFIEKELPQLRQLVDNNLTPEEVCADHLHVCSNTLQLNIWDKIKHGVSDVAHKVEKGMKQAEKKLEDEAKKLGPMLGPLKAMSCPLCTNAVEKAKATLHGKEKEGNDKVTQEICEKAPDSAKFMCQMAMAKFLPMIEKALEDNVSGSKICKDIVHLCQ